MCFFITFFSRNIHVIVEKNNFICHFRVGTTLKFCNGYDLPAIPHSVDKVRQVNLGYGLPLILEKSKQLLQVGRRGMILTNTAAKDVRCVLHRVHVGTVGRPVQSVDLYLRGVGSIVILQWGPIDAE